MLLTLKVVQGPDKGKECFVKEGDCLVVGRGEKCDFRLSDPATSRVHFELSCQDAALTLRDLGSSSGTLVENSPVQVAQIPVGSKINIGDTILAIFNQDDGESTHFVGENSGGEKSLEEMVGSKIVNYRLDEILGRGASGVVFRAFDEEKQRVAALKVLSPRHSRLPQQRERFVRAMKTMIPIRSENIVRIYNAGITGPYLWTAMEYVEGENLAQLIDRIGIEGMLDWRKVWKVAKDIGNALDTAHRHNIVHRNVTPTNILRRSSDERCLLGDLMLAKALEGELAVEITQPGQLIGEIEYLAPERTMADGEIDIRSDLYGLGATCYALLTGHSPAEGKNLTETLQRIRRDTPRPPREYQLAVNELFQDLIVMRLLAKNPADRLQNPAELLEELDRIGRYNSLV
ncbi:MAG: protein kinase [Pirellulaceae bacterium]|nr:protein kinase [Pirellulaceae bacterium]